VEVNSSNQLKKENIQMKKLLSITVIAVVFTTVSTIAQTSAQPAAAKTLSGVVSDNMCGAKHMAKDKSADCTRECVKTGSDYALVVGDKIYPLKGDKAELDKYAGQRATVKGTLDGNNINVQSITGAKKAVASAGKMDHMKMDDMKGMGEPEKQPTQK
jgi:hypothetical protein